MHFYWLILGILAVWRLTHLISAEDGPWNLIFRLRRLAGTSFWGELMDCFYCLSLWFAIPAAYWIGQSWIERAFLWPAISAGAILLERAVPDRRAHESEANHLDSSEEQEQPYVLRQEPQSISHADSTGSIHAITTGSTRGR